MNKALDGRGLLVVGTHHWNMWNYVLRAASCGGDDPWETIALAMLNKTDLLYINEEDDTRYDLACAEELLADAVVRYRKAYAAAIAADLAAEQAAEVADDE